MAKAPVGIEELDFESMEDGQLRELLQRTKDTLAERVTRRMDEFKRFAREAGFEVIVTRIGEGDGRRRRRRTEEPAEGDDKRREVTPKYRNPDNPADVWSGRGRNPKWVQMQFAHGRTLEDLLIRPEPHKPAAEAATGAES